MISHKLNFNGETECRDKIYQTRGDVANNIYIEQRPKYLGFISKKSATYPGLIRFAVLILCTGVVCCLPLKEHNQPVPVSIDMFQRERVTIYIISDCFNPFMPNGLFYLSSLDRSVSSKRGVCLVFIMVYRTSCNLCSVDPNRTPRSAASDLGLHCLPMSLLLDARLKWVSL